MKKYKKMFHFKLFKWVFHSIHSHIPAVIVLSLLNIVVSLLYIVIATTSKKLIDSTVAQDAKRAIIYGVLFAAILFGQIIIHAITVTKRNKLSILLTNQLQKDFMKRYYSLNWQSVSRFHSGDILTRFTTDIANITDACVSLFPRIVALSLKLVAAFYILFIFDKSLALLAFFLSPLSALFSWLVGRKIKKMQTAILTAESNYNSYLNETIQNFLIIKTFEHEKSSLKKVRYHQNNLINLIMKSTRFSAIQNIFLGIGSKFGFFLGLSWGAYRISTQSISYGTFAAFLQLVGQVQEPIEYLARSLPKMMLTITSAERLMALEELESDAVNLPPNPIDFKPTGLLFEGVNFHYDASKDILNNINLSVKPGKIVALVGSSGEGKTTLFRLVLSLIKPIKGALSLELDDGSSIPISSNTRAYFTYVPQGNTLFSGSIWDNLKIGDPSATEAEMVEALLLACAWTFVEKMPNGIYTVIGEHGVGLSEGQAQRICIARAFLRKAPILLLDEATSALDGETEKEILENILKLNPPRTCLAITHRKTIFDICDDIYMLTDGRLNKEER